MHASTRERRLGCSLGCSTDLENGRDRRRVRPPRDPICRDWLCDEEQGASAPDHLDHRRRRGGRTTRRLRRVPAGQPHPPLFVRQARLAAQPGSALLRDLVHRCWADFWTNPAHTEPPHAALMAGEFAVHLRNGDVYSVEATICPCPLSAKQSAEMTTMRFEADQGNSAWSLCASIPDLATHAQKHKEKWSRAMCMCLVPNLGRTSTTHEPRQGHIEGTDLPTLSFMINSFALEVEDGTASTGRLVWVTSRRSRSSKPCGAVLSHPMRSPKLRNGQRTISH